MAEASISVGQNQFKCPVCLDLLNNPVTIPCGHSYCMSCITDCWNLADQTGVYKCPQCRQTFTPRPTLCKNVMFAEMVENLRRSKRRATVSDGTGHVNHLNRTQGNVQQKIQEKESDLQELREVVRTHELFAQKAVEDSEQCVTELICSIKRNFSEVTKVIRDQERAAVSQVEGLMKQLEQEIVDLRRRDAELSNTDDTLRSRLRTMSFPFSAPAVPRITASSHLPYDDVAKSVLVLKEKLEHFCHDEIKRISDGATQSESWAPITASPASPATAPLSPDMADINPRFPPHQMPRPQSRPLTNSKYWNFK